MKVRVMRAPAGKQIPPPNLPAGAQTFKIHFSLQTYSCEMHGGMLSSVYRVSYVAFDGPSGDGAINTRDWSAECGLRICGVPRSSFG